MNSNGGYFGFQGLFWLTVAVYAVVVILLIRRKPAPPAAKPTEEIQKGKKSPGEI